MRALAVVSLLLLAPVAAASLAGAGTVDGQGVLVGGSLLCRIPEGPAAVTLTLAKEAPDAPWRGTLAFSAAGCPNGGGGACEGKGTLGAGVELACSAATAKLGPVVVCIGGPQRPMMVVDAIASFSAENALGYAHGELELRIAGSGVDEILNPCD